VGFDAAPRGFDFREFGHDPEKVQSLTSAAAASSVSMASARLPIRY
jgi:hypothetical protein